MLARVVHDRVERWLVGVSEEVAVWQSWSRDVAEGHTVVVIAHRRRFGHFLWRN